MRSLVAFREPENDDQKRRTEELNRLIERASVFGVGLYLYLNEPHAFLADDPILKRFPDLAGEEEMWPIRDAKRYRMVCTSAQAGKDYVHECSRKMHEALPGIAGSVHINAAESPTHCYCHIITNPGGTIFASTIEHEGIKCPRCAQRTPEEVISDILNLFHAGARAAGSKANIIAWNWDWVMYAPDPQPRLIEQLHPEIMVMAGFECGDDWDECLGPYTWEEVIPGFERLAGTMEHGLTEMDRALFPSANPWDTRLHSYRGASVIPDESDRMNEAERLKLSEELLPADVFESLPELRGIFGLRRLEEWCNGWGLCLIMRSVGHLFKKFRAKKTGAKNYADLLRDLQERELKTIERALPLSCLDGRLGKHLECSSYLMSREQLESKRLALREALGLGS